eukprot:4481482-Amphidinium_carterae.1
MACLPKNKRTSAFACLFQMSVHEKCAYNRRGPPALQPRVYLAVSIYWTRACQDAMAWTFSRLACSLG